MTQLKQYLSVVASTLLCCFAFGHTATAGLVIQSVIVGEDTSFEGFHTFVIELRAGDDGLSPLTNVGSFSFQTTATQPAVSSSIVVPPSNNGEAWGEYDVSQSAIANGFSFSGLYSPVFIAFPPRRDVAWEVDAPEALIATVSYTFAVTAVPTPVAFNVAPTTPNAPGMAGVPAGFIEYIENEVGITYMPHNNGFDSPGSVGGIIRAVPEPNSLLAIGFAFATCLLRRKRLV